MKELKIKLAKFAHRRQMEDNFPESLDACFNYLVPKLTYCCLVKSEHPSYGGEWGAMVRTKGGDASVYDKEAAVALCLAIEKLIDGEVK